MQKADRDGLNPRAAQAGPQARDLSGRRRLSDGAVEVRPLVHAETQGARDNGRSQPRREIVKLGAILAADVDHVLETRRGDQRGPRAFALEQRVGGDRRSVNHFGLAAARGLSETGQDHAQPASAGLSAA